MIGENKMEEDFMELQLELEMQNRLFNEAAISSDVAELCYKRNLIEESVVVTGLVVLIIALITFISKVFSKIKQISGNSTTNISADSLLNNKYDKENKELVKKYGDKVSIDLEDIYTLSSIGDINKIDPNKSYLLLDILYNLSNIPSYKDSSYKKFFNDNTTKLVDLSNDYKNFMESKLEDLVPIKEEYTKLNINLYNKLDDLEKEAIDKNNELIDINKKFDTSIENKINSNLNKVSDALKTCEDTVYVNECKKYLASFKKVFDIITHQSQLIFKLDVLLTKQIKAIPLIQNRFIKECKSIKYSNNQSK